jgi:hypothetical protein
VRIAKQKKGELNYGSVGNGSASHLAMELFKSRAGIDLVHVPYQGFRRSSMRSSAEQVQAGFMVPGIAMGQVRAGKLRALGVTTLGRAASLPNCRPLRARLPRLRSDLVASGAGTGEDAQSIVERVRASSCASFKSDECAARC